MATSGNYRNYFEEDGVRYTHILDPRTGQPERTNLLSVTVLAPDCATADAYATAFMVLGHEKSAQIVKQHPASGIGGLVHCRGRGRRVEGDEELVMSNEN